MPKKQFVPPRIAPLQHIIAESVDDPTEIAAMEKLRKRLKREASKREAMANRRATRPARGQRRSGHRSAP
jgi:hypothetical protein